MRVIYIAGKYRDTTSIDKLNNINHHTRVAYKLLLEGWAVFSPIMNTAHFDDLSQEIIMSNDLEILSRCDAIYVLNNWEDSRGAKMELAVARKLKMEIYYEENIKQAKMLKGGER
ncbi:hypothetical protein LCGC14_0514550 [marine sediment metagenome]|uniref:DUF4406 domain-containing protein n=1 Tax=marine sediment metagenome TaxID=412755 RepID=A0A0F9ULT5_9ZZZZ